MQNDNPFLHNVAMVAIVVPNRIVGSEQVQTPDKDCVRTFFRIGNHRAFPENMNELQPGKGALDKIRGFDNLKTY